MHGALVICSPCYLDSEIARLKDLFIQNDYPDHVVNRCIDKKLSTWSSENVFGPKNFPVYCTLDYYVSMMYLVGLKVKFVKLSIVVTALQTLGSFLSLIVCYPKSKRMSYLPVT